MTTAWKSFVLGLGGGNLNLASCGLTFVGLKVGVAPSSNAIGTTKGLPGVYCAGAVAMGAVIWTAEASAALLVLARGLPRGLPLPLPRPRPLVTAFRGRPRPLLAAFGGLPLFFAIKIWRPPLPLKAKIETCTHGVRSATVGNGSSLSNQKRPLLP